MQTEFPQLTSMTENEFDNLSGIADNKLKAALEEAQEQLIKYVGTGKTYEDTGYELSNEEEFYAGIIEYIEDEILTRELEDSQFI